MLYLILAMVLLSYSTWMFINSLVTKKPLEKGVKVLFGIFFLVGMGMASFALQPVSKEDLTTIHQYVQEYPSLLNVVKEKGDTIYKYEYLEIIQAYKKMKNDDI